MQEAGGAEIVSPGSELAKVPPRAVSDRGAQAPLLADAPLTLALGRAEPARRAWAQETLSGAAGRGVVVAHLPEPASGEVFGRVLADAIQRSASPPPEQVLILIEEAQKLDAPLLAVLTRLLESSGAWSGRLRVVLVGSPELLESAASIAAASQLVSTDQPAGRPKARRSRSRLRIGMLTTAVSILLIGSAFYATTPVPHPDPEAYARPALSAGPAEPDRPPPLTRLGTIAPATLPQPAPPPAPVPASLPNPAPVRPGLLLQARPGDTLESLYAQVYRGLTAPPLADVAALNPGPIKSGDVLTFPAPPEGWTSRVPSLGSADR